MSQKDQAKKFEYELVTIFKMAAVVMEREFPNYGQIDGYLSRAATVLKYARQCNNGEFRGEEW